MKERRKKGKMKSKGGVRGMACIRKQGTRRRGRKEGVLRNMKANQ